MVGLVKGDVVVVPFPFSDLSATKRRPALVIATPGGPDIILCQITSRAISDAYAVRLVASDFATGQLRQASNIRPNRLFTADANLVLYRIGTLSQAKFAEVVARQSGQASRSVCRYHQTERRWSIVSAEHPLRLDERTQRAIAELEQTISDRYPSASFEISPAADDPNIIHLITTVDVDDPDEVGDLVIDRVAELVAEEHLPIHVIPVRTPERIMASLVEKRATQRPARSISLIRDLTL